MSCRFRRGKKDDFDDLLTAGSPSSKKAKGKAATSKAAEEDTLSKEANELSLPTASPAQSAAPKAKEKATPSKSRGGKKKK